MSAAIERARAEGWGEHHAPLVAEFRAWKAERGFTDDDGDAEDMMLHPRLTPEEREWLRAFVERWDEAQREADHAKASGPHFDPGLVTISRAALNEIFGAADSYHDDLITGLEDGTYEDEDGENSALIQRLAVALNEARTALARSK